MDSGSCSPNHCCIVMGDAWGYRCSSVVWGLSCGGDQAKSHSVISRRFLSVSAAPRWSTSKVCASLLVKACVELDSGRMKSPHSNWCITVKCSAVYYWSCITSNGLGSIFLNSQRTLLCSQHLLFVSGLLPANLQGCLLCWKQTSLVDVVLQSLSRHLNELLKIAYPFPRKVRCCLTRAKPKMGNGKYSIGQVTVVK